MTNFKQRVKELEAFVMSIRFNKGLTVIDATFREGWDVPKTNMIGYEQIADKPNYYMLYGLAEDIGIDEILDYIDQVVKLNIEREMKYELLKLKKNELAQLFKNSSLEKCKTIQFKFSVPMMERDSEDEDDYDMPLNEIPINLGESFTPVPRQTLEPVPIPRTPVNKPKQEEMVAPIHVRVTEETDSNLEPVAVIQREVDPAIDAWNKEAQRREVEKYKPLQKTAKVGGETFDLPPREKVVVEVVDYQEPQVVCKCDPNDPKQVCPACVDTKY